MPAGFFLASQGVIDWGLLGATFTGSSLVIASACVLNNYLDQDIDARMERTKTRPLTSGELPGWSAVVFSIILLVSGFGLLWFYTNTLVVLSGIIGFVVYVWLYGALSKRLSWHGTLVGSISGAMPVVAGYLAASNQLDWGVLLVFLVLFFWQMPEFYSIAIYRRNEYAAASIPVITVVKSIPTTIAYIFAYTIAFVASTMVLWLMGYTGALYGITMLLAGCYWLWLGYLGFGAPDSSIWAKKMFRFSLIILLLFCFAISIPF